MCIRDSLKSLIALLTVAGDSFMSSAIVFTEGQHSPFFYNGQLTYLIDNSDTNGKFKYFTSELDLSLIHI